MQPVPLGWQKLARARGADGAADASPDVSSRGSAAIAAMVRYRNRFIVSPPALTLLFPQRLYRGAGMDGVKRRKQTSRSI